MRLPFLRLGCFIGVAAGLCLLAELPPAMGQTKGKKEQFFDTVGEPKGFNAGDSVRYAVWVSKAGVWHVRTTTAKKQHHFTGKIHIEGGVITTIESHLIEHKGKFGDWWRVHDKRHEINIDFKTDRGIDGIDFQVSKDAKRIHFNLYIDGKHRPSLIFVGKDGHHPEQDPFVVPAHPKK